jgi:hypothetical protein
MAGIKIVNLPTAASPNSSDIFPIVNNNLTKQVSFFNAATSIGLLSTPPITVTLGSRTSATQTLGLASPVNVIPFTFNQFNPRLGILTNITHRIVSSQVAGGFNVYAIGPNSVTVQAPSDFFIMYDLQGSNADYNTAGNGRVSYQTSPSTPLVVPAGQSRSFSVIPTNLLLPGVPTVTNLFSYADRYTGVGTVRFDAFHSPAVTIFGGAYNYSPNVVNQTVMELIYEYIPATVSTTTSSNYLIVPVTDNATTNGNNLLNAYAAATTLTPNASALSSTNRAVVFLPPATYNIGSTTLQLNTSGVDIVGMTRDASHVTITSSNTIATIYQTANDVRCIGFTIRNTGAGGYGWVPSSNLTLTYWENIIFDTINASILSGTFKNCRSTNFVSSRGGFVGPSGTASGTFINCTGINTGNDGGGFIGSNGIASGIFTTCTGTTNTGTRGGGFVGYYGIVTGTFINCTGINTGDNGGGFIGDSGSASNTATFTSCIGSNTGFYGGGFIGRFGTASGTFTNCTGSNTGISGGGFVGQGGSSSNTAIFTSCIGRNSDNTNSGGFVGQSGIASGTFTNCIGTSTIFLGQGGIIGSGGTVSGIFISCILSDLFLPGLTASGLPAKPACYVNCLDGSGRLVNGSA